MLYYRGYSKAVLRAVIEQMDKKFHLEFFCMLSDYSTYMQASSSYSEEITHLFPMTLWEIFHGPIHND